MAETNDQLLQTTASTQRYAVAALSHPANNLGWQIIVRKALKELMATTKYPSELQIKEAILGASVVPENLSYEEWLAKGNNYVGKYVCILNFLIMTKKSIRTIGDLNSLKKKEIRELCRKINVSEEGSDYSFVVSVLGAVKAGTKVGQKKRREEVVQQAREDDNDVEPLNQ